MVLFLLIFDLESYTKKVEDIHSFPTGIYSSWSDQRFRFYDFLRADRVAENYNTGQIAVMKEK
jgi:hypothetical protein